MNLKLLFIGKDIVCIVNGMGWLNLFKNFELFIGVVNFGVVVVKSLDNFILLLVRLFRFDGVLFLRWRRIWLNLLLLLLLINLVLMLLLNKNLV